MKKYYYLYQITNNLNEKIYIGIHRTDNLEDGYMGSGILLKKAHKKYGLENFNKEILEYFDSEDDMFNREIELVDIDFVLRKDTYNLIEGGGGISSLEASKRGKYAYENSIGIFSPEAVIKQREYNLSEKNLKNLSDMRKKNATPEALKKRSESLKKSLKKIKHAQREKNSQYGTMWITNGIDSKKISKEEQIPDGWRNGRIQKGMKGNKHPMYGMMWITNGVDNTRIKKDDFIPKGWKKGRV